MGKFLDELHKKPDHHKKRFALLSSATITLFIFGIWSLATFGVSDGGIVASDTDQSSQSDDSGEVSPLQSIRMNLASSLEGIRNSFIELKNGIEAVDIEDEYQDLRDGALETYGE